MANCDKQETDGIVILGQVFCYPKTIYGAVAIFLVCATLVASVYIIFVQADTRTLSTVTQMWRTLKVTPQGEEVASEFDYRIEFWTPSVATQDYLESAGAVPAEDEWQVIDDPLKNQMFGEFLMKDPRVEGFRRAKVVGTGGGSPKEGWWWTMRVDQRLSVEDFIDLYRRFWGTTENVYLEVITVSADG